MEVIDMNHPWYDRHKTMKESAEKHLAIIKKFMALDGRTERQRRIAAHEYWVLKSYVEHADEPGCHKARVRMILRDGGVPYEKYVEVD
jgi:hypothetical protein